VRRVDDDVRPALVVAVSGASWHKLAMLAVDVEWSTCGHWDADVRAAGVAFAELVLAKAAEHARDIAKDTARRELIRAVNDGPADAESAGSHT